MQQFFGFGMLSALSTNVVAGLTVYGEEAAPDGQCPQCREFGRRLNHGPSNLFTIPGAL